VLYAAGMTETTTGRRERKKAATRQALADAALRLFLERGYDRVSVRDIAEAADVSTTTLFKHFPGKEALVFDREAENEAALVAAVRDRVPGQSVLAALCDLILRSTASSGDMDAFLNLVETTPELREYSHRMWMRHQAALARAIAEEAGAPADDPSCTALAHFVLETRGLGRGQASPHRAVRSAFALLEQGWNNIQPHHQKS
jgi:AcrR family transcriptional regulator